MAILGLASGCRPRSASTHPAPTAIEAVNRGVSLMGQYDYEGATAAFESALAAAPDLSAVQVNLAIARFNRGRKETQDIDEASRLLDAVLQREPANARAWYFKGIVLQHLGQAEAAVPCFEKVLEQHPDDGVAWYLLGICKQRIGQSAEQELRRAIELRPYLVSAYYRLWQTLQAAGETERAAPYLEKFKQLREHPLAETIELPQYNQMGELALVVPIGDAPESDSASSIYRAGTPQEILVQPPTTPPRSTGADEADRPFGGAALADLDRDGHLEFLLTGLSAPDGASAVAEAVRLSPSPDETLTRSATAAPPGTSAVAEPARLSPSPDETLTRSATAASPGTSAVAEAVRLSPSSDETLTRSATAAPPGTSAVAEAVRLSPAITGLDGIEAPLTCAIGDYDNDEFPDLFAVTANGNHLFRGSVDGTFARMDDALSAPTAAGRTRSALWFDADHDGDLDLFVCNTGAPNQLFNNNSDGTFVDIAGGTDVAVPDDNSVMILPGDLDLDRDVDLVLLRANAPAKILLNELSGKFREADLGDVAIHGDLGGVLQDFDGDGLLDLLALGGKPAALTLFLGDGRARFSPSPSFAESTQAIAALGPIRGFRVADVDLDGDLDIAVFGREGHLLLNDGRGRFTLNPRVWTASPGAEIAGAELADLTGDLVPDLLLLERGETRRVLLLPGELSPEATALAIAPTGVRSRDKRTRSPASGYGVSLVVRAGLHEQSRLMTGQSGGFNQSPLPLVFGLRGAELVDYVRLHWPDGVAQVERTLATGRVHTIAETQRKISSCPVLFTWNGSRFEFITDFAGVGGLGYLAAPGEYASPTPVDHVKIEPGQLQPRDGFFEVRITEPMEESAYVDRLDLLAIDHPAGWRVFPDERLTITGPPPTRELLVVPQPIFAQRALDPDGADCTDALRHDDRHYAFEPALDRRFFGFSQRHTLELDFGDQLATPGPGARVFLFINGYLEYPYSQTTYAASQAHLGWEPIRVEQQQPDGEWHTIVPDAGALGGASRTMTVDLTGLVGGTSCRLRLTSNLEIYYDQIFLAETVESDRVAVHALPVADAELRYAGIAQEVSPDGRLPLIYDYAQSDPLVPFDTLRGAYTRYGPVRELLEHEDDAFVLMGTGDEIAAKFDASRLPPLAAGLTRSFVLVSYAYCKDMDLYTATPQTLEPMPFRGMSRYPYPSDERPPETPAQRRLRETYQTRIVE